MKSSSITSTALIAASLVLFVVGGYIVYTNLRPPPEEASPPNTVTIQYDFIDSQKDTSEAEKSKLLAHYEEQCEDVMGRLHQSGTSMECPVVRSSPEDKYFRKNLAGEPDTAGVPFMSTASRVCEPSHNMIIYGHRLSSGEDFGSLRKYTQNDYYEAHPTINFETNDGDREWRIISVFAENVQTDAFQYMNYTNLTEPSIRNDFITEIMARSIIPAEYQYQEGDMWLTLSTCHYETDKEYGRLIVVAVSNDTATPQE